MAVQSDSPFDEDELTLHGFHDDRRVMLLKAATRVVCAIVENLDDDDDAFYFDPKAGPAKRQLIADAALDIVLRLAHRIDDKPDKP